MSFIELGDEFGSTSEPKVAPEGRQFDLVCRNVEEVRKNDRLAGYRVDINIEGESEDYQTIFHHVSLPNRELDQQRDEEKGHPPGTTTRTKLLMLKRFLTAFNVPFEATGFNPADIQGARARLNLTQEVYNNRRSNRLALPELPGESSGDTSHTDQPAKKKSKE